MIMYQEYEGLEVIREWWQGTRVTVWVIRSEDGYTLLSQGGFMTTQDALNWAIDFIHNRSYQAAKSAAFAQHYGS